ELVRPPVRLARRAEEELGDGDGGDVGEPETGVAGCGGERQVRRCRRRSRRAGKIGRRRGRAGGDGKRGADRRQERWKEAELAAEHVGCRGIAVPNGPNYGTGSGSTTAAWRRNRQGGA